MWVYFVANYLLLFISTTSHYLLALHHAAQGFSPSVALNYCRYSTMYELRTTKRMQSLEWSIGMSARNNTKTRFVIGAATCVRMITYWYWVKDYSTCVKLPTYHHMPWKLYRLRQSLKNREFGLKYLNKFTYLLIWYQTHLMSNISINTPWKICKHNFCNDHVITKITKNSTTPIQYNYIYHETFTIYFI